MEPVTTISLVRHGVVDNPHDIYYGRLPGFGLSSEGRSQAQAAAGVLGIAPYAVIFSSPLLRARQTARIIRSAGVPLPLRRSSLLNEVATHFDGSPLSVVTARNWDVYSGSGLGYEQPIDVAQRMLRFIAQVHRRFRGHHIIAVTHGDCIAFTRLWALGMPIEKSGDPQQSPIDYPSPGSICTLRFRSDTRDERPECTYVRPTLPRAFVEMVV